MKCCGVYSEVYASSVLKGLFSFQIKIDKMIGNLAIGIKDRRGKDSGSMSLGLRNKK